MASTYISRTPSSNGSETTGTFSAWIKRSSLGSYQKIYCSRQADNEFFLIQFLNDDKLQVNLKIGGTDYLDLRTNAVFRDVSAWLHVVVTIDGANGTQSDRARLYINGTRETSFSTNTNNMSQNINSRINGTAQTVFLGTFSGSGDYFDGSMTHLHWIDGTAYDASTFGQTDSTSGIWKPKTSPSVTYGTNGFFLKFENSGNLDLDSSGNNLSFTTSGTITQTEDTPSNNFATLNPLYPYTSTGAFTNGNTAPSDYAVLQGIVGTLGASSGKYYFEVKINGSSGERGMVGWGARDTGQITYAGGGAYDWARYNNTTSYYSNATETQISGSSAYTTGDICGCAIDLDNNYIYWYKNGVLENTGGTAITASSTAGNYFPIVRNGNGNNIQCNFGNGYFGTTAVSSSNSDSAGLGLFEYSVPSGYYALCTKNIKNYG